MKASFQDEVLRTVMEDLLYVTKEWKKDIDDDQLRRDCTVLRRLLIEDNLGRVWRKVGFRKQPRILTPVLNIIGDKKRVSFAQAGLALYKGLEVQAAMYHGDVPEELTMDTSKQVKQELGKPVKKPLFLSDFLTSTCIIVNGTEISRHDLILYVANTLGGIHLEWDREFGKQPSMKVIFESLDTHYKTGVTANKESIYYELLSIGQSLANSRDISRLIKHIKQIINGH
ncbi:hypothetical protein ACFLXK_02095 [Chloroflexota bacterium]